MEREVRDIGGKPGEGEDGHGIREENVSRGKLIICANSQAEGSNTMWVEKCPLCLALRKTLGVVVNVDARTDMD